MNSTKQFAIRPAVQLIGDLGHPDFRDAIELLCADALIVDIASLSPELIVVAQGRPGVIEGQQINALRRAAPLAGIVALVGSWCEGETRTGRPWPGVERLHWYEFPSWWRRQMALRSAGRCPDWSRPGDYRFRIENCESPTSNSAGSRPHRGLVVLRVPDLKTANTLTDLLRHVGYSTAWQPPGRSIFTIRGAIAGVWDGGQLNDREANDLSTFCRQLANDGAPVLAMLDFPRRDCVDRAMQIGVAAVLGKPWLNVDLVATLQEIVEPTKLARAA